MQRTHPLKISECQAKDPYSLQNKQKQKQSHTEGLKSSEWLQSPQKQYRRLENQNTIATEC